MSNFTDITEQKQTEDRYKQLLEYMNDGCVVIQEGEVVFANRRFGEMLGYAKEQMVGLPIFDITLPTGHEALRQAVKERYKRVMSKKKAISEQHETISIKEDANIIIVDLSSRLIQYEGKPAVYIIARDITEIKLMEKLLQDSKERYQALTKNISDCVAWEVNTEGIITYTSQNVKDLVGYEPEEIIGKTFNYFMIPEDAKRIANEFSSRMKSRRSFERLEHINLHKDDGFVMLESSAVPFFDDDGNLQGYRGICHDVTERRKADEELRKANEKLRLVFERAPYGVIVTDSNMIISQVNDKALKLFGVTSKNQIIGKSGFDFFSRDQNERIIHYLNRCIYDDLFIDAEHPFTKVDGSKIIAATSAGALRDSNGDLVGFMAITRDVTYEKQLKENEQFYITETIKAEEDGRKQLARALHDDTIQEMLFTMHSLRLVISGKYGHLAEHAHGHLENIYLLIEKTVADIRRFTTDLRPDILDDMGLVPSLKWLTDRLRNEDALESKLKILGKERRLSPETESILFRITQEALNNIRKHAVASVVNVTLAFNEDKIILSISDDGRGFQIPDAISHFAKQQKLGLIGLTERVRLLGGIYEIKSSPGKGTVIKVEIRDERL